MATARRFIRPDHVLRWRAAATLLIVLGAGLPALGVQIGELPGEDVSGLAEPLAPAPTKASEPAKAKPTSWLSPAVDEQLTRERTLIPLGKGAVFVPTFTEPRREPEVTVFDRRGREVRTGQTGERILLDSGAYSVRLGSGTSGQRMPYEISIEEGHTTVVPVDWGGLLVETLTPDGKYFEGQYEVIRMERWINYGKGHGLNEERLQDIKMWVLPPGLYRISKPGEGFTSLRNYITVQINAGELTPVELIFDKVVAGDVVAGGIKTLNARVKVGSNWSFGARIGGNVNLTRETKDDGVRHEAMQVNSDVRLRLLFDNAQYLGSSEIFLQDNFGKERGKPFSVTSDIAQFRTNWVRRLNAWLGPYVRGTLDSHIFPSFASQDTIYALHELSGGGLDTVKHTGSNSFEVGPVLDPLNLGEGAGVNVEFLSRYYLEASTQVGLAGRQTLANHSYVRSNDSLALYVPVQSSYEIGIENTLNATFRLGSQMTLDLRTEIFAPNANPSRIRLDDLTADFRFFLSRNLEIGYIYQVQETKVQTKNRFPSTHNISLRLSFNY